MANAALLKSVALDIANDKPLSAYKKLMSSDIKIQQLRLTVYLVYQGKLKNVSKIVTFLKHFSESLNFAAVGADALYSNMEVFDHLETPEILVLHKFVDSWLVQRMNRSVNCSKASKFRTYGLVKATEVHLDSIYGNWAKVLLSFKDIKETSMIANATKKFPESVDLPRLIREGYSKNVWDALKIVDFINSLSPNLVLVMLGFEELFVQICNKNNKPDQVDTYIFMEVVHKFKEAAKERDNGDDSGFLPAKSKLPAGIQSLFFPPSGFCLLYSPSNNIFMTKPVLRGVLGLITLSNIRSHCKFKFASYYSIDSGLVFKMQEMSGSGLSLEQFLVPSIGLAAMLEVVSLNEFKIKPYKHGELYTLINVPLCNVLVAERAMSPVSDGFKFDKVTSYNQVISDPRAFWKFLNYEDS